MKPELDIIRGVIDRVLWTAGANEQNRSLLADAIQRELEDQRAAAKKEAPLYQELLDDAAAACADANSRGVITSVKVARHMTPAPLPFTREGLQRHMGQLGFYSKATFRAAQELYEKGAISYPVTDCRYLNESSHQEAEALLRQLGAADSSLCLIAQGANPLMMGPAFNDNMVVAHAAIVPRAMSSDKFAELSSLQQHVWREVSKRYILQFHPAAESRSTAVEVERLGKSELLGATVEVFRGWQAAVCEPQEARP